MEYVDLFEEMMPLIGVNNFIKEEKMNTKGKQKVKIQSTMHRFMKQKNTPDFESVMFVSEPSMNVSYRHLEKFPDPYAEFSGLGFELYNFKARCKRYRFSKKSIIIDIFLGVNRRSRTEFDFSTGPFQFSPETQVEKVNKRFQHLIKEYIAPTSPNIYKGIIKWLQLQHISSKEIFTFRYEDSVPPNRFVCTEWEVPGLKKEVVNKKNLPHIKEMTSNLAKRCYLTISKKEEEKLLCLS